MDLAEFANQMSEVLFGYRECLEEDMLNRARALIDLEKTVKQRKKLRKIKHVLSTCLEKLNELGVD